MHTVSISASGYKPFATRLTLRPGQKQPDVIATLEQKLVTVTVKGTPLGARVIVDGKDRGALPLVLRLPPGTYRMHAQKGGFVTGEDQQIALKDGVDTDLDLSLAQQQVAVAPPPAHPVTVLAPPHPGSAPRHEGREKWEVLAHRHLGPISLGDPLSAHPDFEHKFGRLYVAPPVAFVVDDRDRVVAVAIRELGGGPEARTPNGLTWNSTEAQVRSKQGNEINKGHHRHGEGLMMYDGIGFVLQHDRVKAMVVGDAPMVRMLMSQIMPDAPGARRFRGL